MAKIKLAGAVGEISGSVGANCYSRNRYGPYMRLRSVPTLVQNAYTYAVREAFSNASRLWFDLTEKEQEAWNQWSRLNPVTDRLGAKVVLAGNAAFIRINSFLLQAGLSTRYTPPVGENPQSLASITLSTDMGAGNFQIAYTATPLAADTHLVVFACLRQTLQQNFLRNAWRLLKVSAAEAASPYDMQSDFEGRFGELTVGQVVHVKVALLTGSLGLVGAPLVAQSIIVETGP